MFWEEETLDVPLSGTAGIMLLWPALFDEFAKLDFSFRSFFCKEIRARTRAKRTQPSA
jgi:hypothetical protein